MTRIEFIFNLQNIISHTVDLCENYVANGRRLTVNCGTEEVQSALSKALWTQSETSFLPNETTQNAHAVYAPINLNVGGGKLTQDDILINLDEEIPMFFGRFNHLIELVGAVESNKEAARSRWKFYRDRGYAMQSTDSRQAS